ncbi:MAG: flagellar basal body-associated FliL family protein [Gluconacetobacter diazotrophicus]|nr:flagellar basal body-associated FliL family protein [Gluconacetobacter diazotrophicus]
MSGSDEKVVAGGNNKRRRLVLVAGLGGMMLLGGAGVSVLGGFGIGGGTARAKATRDGAAKPVLVDVPDIISNLDTAGHRATFVKLHARIQVNGEEAAKQVTAGMPRVQDVLQSYLRSMRPDELKGGEGMYRLREALIYRLDGAFAPVEVEDVLFTELLVQ